MSTKPTKTPEGYNVSMMSSLCKCEAGGPHRTLQEARDYAKEYVNWYATTSRSKREAKQAIDGWRRPEVLEGLATVDIY